MRNSSTESLQNLDLYSGMIGPLTLEVLFGEAMKRENLAMALNTWAELRGSWLHPSAKVPDNPDNPGISSKNITHII